MEKSIFNKGEITNMYPNRTKPDTIARSFVQSLQESIMQENTEDNEDWRKLAHVLQTADWIHRRLEQHFDDGTGDIESWHGLREVSQKSFFKGSFRSFFLAFEVLRVRLGYPKEIARGPDTPSPPSPPVAFQRMIDNAFAPDFCRAFMDGGGIKPTIKGTHTQEHGSLVKNIRRVFELLRQAAYVLSYESADWMR